MKNENVKKNRTKASNKIEYQMFFHIFKNNVNK